MEESPNTLLLLQRYLHLRNPLWTRCIYYTVRSYLPYESTLLNSPTLLTPSLRAFSLVSAFAISCFLSWSSPLPPPSHVKQARLAALLCAMSRHCVMRRELCCVWPKVKSPVRYSRGPGPVLYCAQPPAHNHWDPRGCASQIHFTVPWYHSIISIRKVAACQASSRGRSLSVPKKGLLRFMFVCSPDERAWTEV
jgi:hypothetical protein